MNTNKSIYFQDYMPGSVCFGCGTENGEGLHVRSYWEGEVAVCHWESETKYNGWKNILNGGIMATLIDCHCINTAMAAAYRAEDRDMDTAPSYGYATGTLNIKYLKPTPNDKPVELRAKVLEIKGRKTTLFCEFYSQGVKTAEAEVIAIRVIDTSLEENNNMFSKSE